MTDPSYYRPRWPDKINPEGPVDSTGPSPLYALLFRGIVFVLSFVVLFLAVVALATGKGTPFLILGLIAALGFGWALGITK